MKFIVNLDRDESGMIVAECPAIPGCVSQGKTEAEALDNIREAIPFARMMGKIYP
jgi:predicted RNase H-like HicB family nuclease